MNMIECCQSNASLSLLSSRFISSLILVGMHGKSTVSMFYFAFLHFNRNSLLWMKYQFPIPLAHSAYLNYVFRFNWSIKSMYEHFQWRNSSKHWLCRQIFDEIFYRHFSKTRNGLFAFLDKFVGYNYTNRMIFALFSEFEYLNREMNTLWMQTHCSRFKGG